MWMSARCCPSQPGAATNRATPSIREPSRRARQLSMPKLATRSVSKIWLDRLAKDRKSNATFGSIFESGGLSQSPISHQEVLGAAIKPPQRTPALPVARTGAAGGDFSGYRHESSLASGGSSCLILFWDLPGPTRRCADRTRPPVRAGRLDPTEDRSPPDPPLPPPTAMARAPGRCAVAGWIRRCGRGSSSRRRHRNGPG